MSEYAIMGSFKLWIDFQKRNNHDLPREEETEELTLVNQVNIEEIENDDENIEDNLKFEMNGTVEPETNSHLAVDLQIIDSIEDSEHETDNELPTNMEVNF
jgi:hypothetical protein